jgi:hypothetical protein
MLAKTWSEILVQSLQNLWLGVADFVPRLLLAVVVFIIGWLIAELIKKAIVHLLDALKFDKLLASTGLEKVIEKAGYKLHAGLFIGWLVKWFIIIVFLVASLQIVGLTQVNVFLNEVVLIYIPNVIVAALVLLIASIVADLAEKIISGSSQAVGVKSAPFLGAVARWAIWIFAIIIALAQLGIATQFIQVLFTGAVAMLALAGGLAFGLGGKDAAADAVDKLKSSIKSHQ